MKLLGACLLLSAAFAHAGSLLQDAPPRTGSVSNPLEGHERALRAGAKLFARECASCHGENAAGGVGTAPPLRHAGVYKAAPGKLFWVLRNGSLRHGMPSFAHLPEAQRWQIITWLTTAP